jgi:magnesium chelatase family protein
LPAVLASVATFAIEGVGSREVTVEVDVRRGLPVFTLVGLPDRAIREARERVRAALLNCGLDFPQQRLTVNLAPAHVRKAGPGFDLAIAVGVLAATGQVPVELVPRCALYGELSLAGTLRPGRGALAVALGARDAGYPRLAVPPADAGEAALVEEVEVIPVEDLNAIAGLLRGERPAQRASPRRPRARGAAARLDLADVRGQEDAKRALEIAAAGGHNLLMVGPPGAGKTMLARRLPGILPPPSFEEALEITRIRGVAGLGGGGLASERPFRAPHHTISPQGLIGGGSTPRPGEATLAHRGVLFLDELAEFARPALDALRQPLEEGKVDIMRGQRTIEFPARAMVVAATNPCPCGRPADRCTCDAVPLGRYARRLSGPLLDRVDLVCRLGPVAPLELVDERRAEGSSRTVRQRVLAARDRQRDRLAGTEALCNGDMDGRLTRRAVRLDGRLRARVASLAEPTSLSGRGHDRVLRVARTIADLDGRTEVAEHDLDEALAYRVGALAVAA